ncbi:hypothetical protein B0T25DRAFT_43651 [Lasiosphaeria hispida]|uniref:Nitrogen regulatory protein areA GATA-like domain-containing protein n=1 Tax=Lasiosphaeria hispida TaxID=260671 RepID=A0AAJ0MK85_9PEZI|nr:hypothetical protein B0T25DRAFT_43651 [Lasiosphaeria hispida]
MAMILPKGILENTSEIYAEVASYPVVPPEKIWQYWNVYTTTFRRLVDPTAYRLENFWWHVWGSDRRNLSGPALARLFEEFSMGPTFVPLRSPANRYEGPTTPRFIQQGLDILNSESVQMSQGQSSSSSKGGVKSPTPSSSRPPPPHPILKKSRGPSASGPRPTARFVSPPGSDDEDIRDGEVSSGSTAMTASEMPPPPLPSPAKREEIPDAATTPAFVTPVAKAAPVPAPTVPTAALPRVEMRPPPIPSPARSGKSANPTRRIVASTAASKRRPVIPRRASSQSSTGSETGVREAVTTMAAAARQRTMLNAMEHSGRGSSHDSAASSSSQTSQSSGLTMKAVGKRSAKSSSGRRSAPRTGPSQADGQQERPVAVQPGPSAVPQRRSTWDVKDSVTPQEVAQSRNDSTPCPAPVAGFVVDQGATPVPPRIARSISNIESPQRLREGGASRLPSQALLATSVVATSTATAQGQFGSDRITPTSTLPEARDIPDDLMLSSRPSSATLLDMQFTPTQPNPTPPIPFGRSKSQLTLLLEREKTRKGEGI